MKVWRMLIVYVEKHRLLAEQRRQRDAQSLLLVHWFFSKMEY
jgi:hypothetical protein